MKRAFPRRFRWTRLARQVAVWLPSALAAFVLFFLPLASHLVQPGRIHFGRYSMKVPWNVLILPGPSSNLFRGVMAFAGDDNNPLGITHSFRGNRFTASMYFVVDFISSASETIPREPTHEFKLGLGVLRCWEGEMPAGFRDIFYTTSSPVHDPAFHAWFFGKQARVPLFYQILSTTEIALP